MLERQEGVWGNQTHRAFRICCPKYLPCFTTVYSTTQTGLALYLRPHCQLPWRKRETEEAQDPAGSLLTTLLAFVLVLPSTLL